MAAEWAPDPALSWCLKEGTFTRHRKLTRDPCSWLEGKGGGFRKGIMLEVTPGLNPISWAGCSRQRELHVPKHKRWRKRRKLHEHVMGVGERPQGQKTGSRACLGRTCVKCSVLSSKYLIRLIFRSHALCIHTESFRDLLKLSEDSTLFLLLPCILLKHTETLEITWQFLMLPPQLAEKKQTCIHLLTYTSLWSRKNIFGLF